MTASSASIDPIDLVTLSPHGPDRLSAELGAQPADVDVDHVGSWVEVVLPYRGEQPLLGDGRAGVPHQLAQQQELALGEGDRPVAAVGLPAHQVEAQAS